MTYAIHASRNGHSVVTIRISPISAVDKAREQSGCRYKDDIKDAPVRFIRPEGRRLAIVFCSGIAVGSHQVFDVRNVLKPTLVELPFLAQPDG